MTRDVVVLADPAAVADLVATRFLERMAAAQQRGEVPHVALTGGTIAGAIHRQIAQRAAEYDVDWTNIAFWWGDERFVAPDSDDRNARGARQAFLNALGATQVHEMPSTATASSVSDAAAAYADEVRGAPGTDFDLVMLGMGPDGHVASLFPGFAQLDIDDAIAVGVTNSPKPPPERVSLTFAALNRSKAVWFLVTGAEKAAATARAWAFEGSVHETPARGIAGPSITWFVDQAAAGR
ncbi:MAG: 6-phosphogluconolactonase [Marmoricola sp.]|nr:6-phosphogluconolactonase [Marmoricola sp.]